MSSQDNKTALLIIDIQNDYFVNGNEELEGSMQAGFKAKELLDYFRKNQLAVIHIQHEMIPGNGHFFLANTEGQKIHANVYPNADELVITKNYVSSFQETELMNHLQEKGIEHLVICGMQTNVCVQGTSTDEVAKGFKITLIEDAIAAKTAAVHQETMSMLGKEVSEIISTNEWIKQNIE